MSKFSINLQHLSLPDAIAAVVEAWYDAQSIDDTHNDTHNDAQIEITLPSLVRLSDWIKAIGVSRSTAYRLMKLIEIEPETRRVSDSRTPVSHLSAEQIQQLQPWAEMLVNGSTIASVKARIAASREGTQ